ncbi:LysR family transcriptional regulator [Vibrio mangrovi]|uniref:Glycine cleavage system transcriptional activator n=1 Tax=Vibrio mangrovi TaxID=474394 RepID=A0A1Y6IQK4_9VIBR|nr:LysR family transcriptional regulator [Vibrio mangrovi]MDW6003295.1 LysR family transcriptional regulator [Vibrio mangrovi]SMR99916.1 Glycine cleavage system transcriptional activator [Vibrio mangrovi]
MNSVKLAPLLLIFVEVANKRSFTEAARKLGLSKSAISQQIKRLEDALGQQLLVRNTRGVILTTVGEALLARSELLSEQLSLTLKELESSKAQPTGKFKISIPPFLEKDIVIPAISQLCLEFPGITPEVVVTGRWQDLVEHELDAAVFGGDLRDCDYRALSIGKVAEIFCASPRYLQRHAPVKHLEQLSEHRIIATPWQHDELQLFDNNQTNRRLFCVTHSAKATSLTTILEMALHDMGIVLFPEFLVQTELMQQRLVRVLPEIQGRAWHFYFLHQYQGEKPKHVSRFYELLKYYFDKTIAHCS